MELKALMVLNCLLGKFCFPKCKLYIFKETDKKWVDLTGQSNSLIKAIKEKYNA